MLGGKSWYWLRAAPAPWARKKTSGMCIGTVVPASSRRWTLNKKGSPLTLGKKACGYWEKIGAISGGTSEPAGGSMSGVTSVSIVDEAKGHALVP